MALSLVAAASAETCNSCSSCTERLDATGSAELSTDLSATSNCITITRNNSVLDCVSHMIRGQNGADGITVRDASFVTIRNCRISNFSIAIRLESASNATIQNNELVHMDAIGDAFYVRGSMREHYNHVVSGVTIDGKPLRYAFEQTGSIGADGDGLVVIAYSPSASIKDVNLSYGDGLRIYHSPSVSVDNVTVLGGKSVCIGAYMSSSVALSRSSLVGCAKNGLDIESSPGSVLRSNTVVDAADRSINVHGGPLCSDYQQDIDATNTVNGIAARYLYGVSGQTIVQNTTSLSISCSSGVIISGVNVSYGDSVLLYRVNASSFSGLSADEGIELTESSGNSLTSSVVTSASHGITMVSSDNNTVSRNVIAAVGGNAIHMDSSKGNAVIGNVIEDVAGDGVYIYRSQNITVAGNNVSQCGGSGIIIKCSQNSIVAGCNSSYNNMYGISINEGPGIRVEGSTFQSNDREGLHIEGQDPLTNYVIWHNNIFANSGSLAQVVAPHALSLSMMNQGSFWGRTTRPSFVAGVDSSRLDITDLFPYWKAFGWLFIPVVTSAFIEPSKASAPLNCTFIASDQNNATLYANVTWLKGGATASVETVPVQNGTAMLRQLNGMHKRGENWSCAVTPYDGDNYGYMINSTNVTIGNSEPTTPMLYAPATNATLYNTSVSFSYVSSDADGDNLTYYIFIDGTLTAVSSLNATSLVIPSGSHLLAIRASDGYTNSSYSEIRPFTVSPSSAPPAGQGNPGQGGGGDLVNISFPDKVEMKQNEVKTYPFSVRAADVMVVSVEASSSSCYGCSFRMDPLSAELKAGQAAYFQLTITVPISQPAGDYGIAVKVVKGGADAGKKSAVLTVTALPVICALDESKCDGDRVVTCNVYKTGWVEKRQCEFGCLNATCKSEPQLCTPNEIACNGNQIQTCSSRGNAWVAGQDCIFGCQSGACVAGIDPAVIILPLAVTVAAVSGVVVYFYTKARGKRKQLDQEREWRRMESRYNS